VRMSSWFAVEVLLAVNLQEMWVEGYRCYQPSETPRQQSASVFPATSNDSCDT